MAEVGGSLTSSLTDMRRMLRGAVVACGVKQKACTDNVSLLVTCLAGGRAQHLALML